MQSANITTANISPNTPKTTKNNAAMIPMIQASIMELDPSKFNSIVVRYANTPAILRIIIGVKRAILSPLLIQKLLPFVVYSITSISLDDPLH